MSLTHTANPEKALSLTAHVVEMYTSFKEKSHNIAYSHLTHKRAEYFSAIGKSKDVKKEFKTLTDILAEREVNANVLDQIKKEAEKY
jgi:ssDNA-specific exonuclease RecJ